MPGDRTSIDGDVMRSHALSAEQLLKALANRQRLLIACLLASGERSVGELNSQLELSQSALSQHLAVLRREAVVATRRDGQTILYSLPPGPARELVQTLYGIYCSRQ